MTREDTATALAGALRAHVADVEAPAGFLRAVRNREAARRRAALTVGAVAAAVLMLVAGGAVAARVAAPPAPVAPTASASPAAPSASPATAARPRMEPTWLPPGFDPTPVNPTSGPPPSEPGDPDRWVEEVRYWRRGADGRPLAVLVLMTWSGEVVRPSAAYYREIAYEPTARQVRVGSRMVWHVRNHLPKGLDVYEWLEAPGVLVDVTGMEEVTDAEVRRFIAGLRRVA